MNIEEISTKFEGITPSSDDRWSIESLIEGKLHLSKSSDKNPALIIEGSAESFGMLPLIASIQHSVNVIALPSGRKFEALRITAADGENSQRALAHIAYEFAWRLGRFPTPSNQDLMREVGWLFPLLGGQRLPMTPERQLGLIGETLFLRRLLQRAHFLNKDIKFALDCWKGAEPAKRDFYNTNIAVEVKTTSLAARLHHIGSIDQLVPQTRDESLYLFSIGVRRDPTAPKRLTHYVADIESLLVDEQGNPDPVAIATFRNQTSTYGFDWSDQDLYERENGFLAPHLAPELFDVSNLNYLTINHFVDGKIPETVRSVSYVLEVVGQPVISVELIHVLDRLLGEVC